LPKWLHKIDRRIFQLHKKRPAESFNAADRAPGFFFQEQHFFDKYKKRGADCTFQKKVPLFPGTPYHQKPFKKHPIK